MSDIPSAKIRPLPSELPAGYRLLNYVIERKLGNGAFGITYLAHEDVTDYKVVIKESFPEKFVYREPGTYAVQAYPKYEESACWALGNFEKEARTLRFLTRQDNIVQVNTVFRQLNTGYIVMDYIEGKNLHEIYPAGSSIEKEELERILRRLLQALDLLHSKGIIHRDIKAENIMMSATGEPVLIDFGAARPALPDGTATQISTPGYAPPEQTSKANYDKHPKRQHDLYALGATCYRLITGNEPDYVPCKLAEDAELVNRYGAVLLRGIDRARELLPAARWQSAQQWLDELTAEERAREAAVQKEREEAPLREKKLLADLAQEKKIRRKVEQHEKKLQAELDTQHRLRSEAEKRAEKLTEKLDNYKQLALKWGTELKQAQLLEQAEQKSKGDWESILAGGMTGFSFFGLSGFMVPWLRSEFGLTVKGHFYGGIGLVLLGIICGAIRKIDFDRAWPTVIKGGIGGALIGAGISLVEFIIAFFNDKSFDWSDKGAFIGAWAFLTSFILIIIAYIKDELH